MYVIGPLSSSKSTKLKIPIVSPDPKDLSYGTYSVYFGGNRGRGQIYPNGEKSNNTVYTSPVKGRVEEVIQDTKNRLVVIQTESQGESVRTDVQIPEGPEIIVQKGSDVIVDQPLTTNPNVGGFGQVQTEFVFQSPSRLISLQAFLWSTLVAQIFLVLKKKQIEQTEMA